MLRLPHLNEIRRGTDKAPRPQRTPVSDAWVQRLMDKRLASWERDQQQASRDTSAVIGGSARATGGTNAF